jgi:hypothetical protein
MRSDSAPVYASGGSSGCNFVGRLLMLLGLVSGVCSLVGRLLVLTGLISAILKNLSQHKK